MGLLDQWDLAFSDFSTCALTKPEDKLVAISGVARVIAAKLEDEYLGGIWRKNIAKGLLWTSTWTLDTRETSRSASCIGAPAEALYVTDD
jgi:hypothetical protein